MALNYRRLGQARKAVIALILGILATGLLVLLGWHSPRGVASPIALVCLLVLSRSARSLQGTAVKEHMERGGRLASKWTAFGLGAACLAALFACVLKIANISTVCLRD